MTYRLYDSSASPFCIKVRAILDYKHIPFERLPAERFSVMAELKRRGRIGKVPALDLDGTLVCDSTDIAYALEQHHPAPAIIPADPRERALCHVLEDWADESLYWLGIYYRWEDPEGRKGASAIFPQGVVGQQVLPRVIQHFARKQLEGQGTGRKPPEHVARDLDRQLDQLATLLSDRDYLLGALPMLCDFAVMGQLVYLQRTPHGKAAIQDRGRLALYLEHMKAHRRPHA